jgi:hypothetical protein
VTDTTAIPRLLEALTDEVRELVEGIHGRPRRKRGTTVVLSQVICSSSEPCWISKVKFGSLVVAKTEFGHPTPEAALGELLERTKRALGIRG